MQPVKILTEVTLAHVTVDIMVMVTVANKTIQMNVLLDNIIVQHTLNARTPDGVSNVNASKAIQGTVSIARLITTSHQHL